MPGGRPKKRQDFYLKKKNTTQVETEEIEDAHVEQSVPPALQLTIAESYNQPSSSRRPTRAAKSLGIERMADVINILNESQKELDKIRSAKRRRQQISDETIVQRMLQRLGKRCDILILFLN